MDLLIFDLDGTLIDSKLDIASSVNAARAHLGLDPLEVPLVLTYVGHGAPVLVRKALGARATEDAVAEALQFFLEHYREHALDTTRLYPGVAESLERLHAAGKRLAVLTNKPVAVSRTILAGLCVSRFFFQIYGGNSFSAKKPDPAGVEKLMSEAGIGRAGTMIVGDSAVDVETARNSGVRACGVTYGFSHEGFDRNPPDLLIDRMEDLADWVLRKSGETD
ncbi:MAG: HAD-IA family hydrolase [Acidobacteriia bacterium]|nr:HAD-IA family hydrolase [Terriglobia bacterium]